MKRLTFQRPSWAVVARWLTVLVLSVNALGFLLQPISDPDFFWHLRTGEWMLEHRVLPQELISSASPRQTPAEIERFTATSYWLAQLLLALLHGAGGMGAIVALRWLLFSLFLLLLARRARGDALVRAGLLSLAVVLLGRIRPSGRSTTPLSSAPPCCCCWMASGRRGPPKPPAGGRRRPGADGALGQLPRRLRRGARLPRSPRARRGARRLDRRLAPLPPERLRTLLAAAGGGFLASLLNPNGWLVFRFVSLPAADSSFVSEYRSTVEIFRFNADPGMVVYWLILALAAAGLTLRWRKPDPAALGLVLLTGFYSFTQVRYIPFFIAAALPAIVAALSDPRVVRQARAAVAALGLCAGASSCRRPCG